PISDITRMVGVWLTRPRVVGTGVMPRVGALVSLLEQLADTRRDAGNHLYGDDGEDRQDDQRDHHTTDGRPAACAAVGRLPVALRLRPQLLAALAHRLTPALHVRIAAAAERLPHALTRGHLLGRGDHAGREPTCGYAGRWGQRDLRALRWRVLRGQQGLEHRTRLFLVGLHRLGDRDVRLVVRLAMDVKARG